MADQIGEPDIPTDLTNDEEKLSVAEEKQSSCTEGEPGDYSAAEMEAQTSFMAFT